MAVNMRISRRNKIYANSAVSDPDTMYFRHAMNVNDTTQFLNAAHKEFSDLISKVFLGLIPRIIVTELETLLPTVWSMKQKRQVQTKNMYKYNARLNLDGSKMYPGVHCNHNYAQLRLVSTLEYCYR